MNETPAEIASEKAYRYDEAKGRKCTDERARAEVEEWMSRPLANAYENPETLAQPITPEPK